MSQIFDLGLTFNFMQKKDLVEFFKQNCLHSIKNKLRPKKKIETRFPPYACCL